MGPANASGFAVPSGGEDYLAVLYGFGSVSGAVPDVASEPFIQRIMELAISSPKRADAFAATNMGLPESVLRLLILSLQLGRYL